MTHGILRLNKTGRKNEKPDIGAVFFGDSGHVSIVRIVGRREGSEWKRMEMVQTVVAISQDGRMFDGEMLSSLRSDKSTFRHPSSVNHQPSSSHEETAAATFIESLPSMLL